MTDDRPLPFDGRLGIVGAGRVGITVARRALDTGFEVAVASSRPVEETARTLAEKEPDAQAVDVAGAAAFSAAVVLALPIQRLDHLDPRAFDGKVVIDTTNHWPALDGPLDGFDLDGVTTSEAIQRRLPDARVVKTLNQTAYFEIESHARPWFAPDRRGLGVAGDDPDAVEQVARLVDVLGFDPVVLGPLRWSTLIQPGGPAFGSYYRGSELRELAAEAVTP